MQKIQGTVSRQKSTDYYQLCKRCKRLFYIDWDSNRRVVVCPFCGAEH